MDKNIDDAYLGGELLTQNALARLLRPFGIAPRTLRFGDKTASGYSAEWFADAFRTYLPDSNLNTSTPPLAKRDSGTSQPQHELSHVEDGNRRESAPEAGCLDVEVEPPQGSDGDWVDGEAV